MANGQSWGAAPWQQAAQQPMWSNPGPQQHWSSQSDGPHGTRGSLNGDVRHHPYRRPQQDQPYHQQNQVGKIMYPHPPAYSHHAVRPHQPAWQHNQQSTQWAGAQGQHRWARPHLQPPVQGAWQHHQQHQQHQQPWHHAPTQHLSQAPQQPYNPWYPPPPAAPTATHHLQQQQQQQLRPRSGWDARPPGSQYEVQPGTYHAQHDIQQGRAPTTPHQHRQGGLVEQYNFADPSSATKYDELEPQLPGNQTGDLGPEEVKAEVERRKTLPILLFDLNGTLTSHTFKRRSAGVNRMRPGVALLPQLLKNFRLGIYTSSTIRTVATVKALIEKEAGCPLFEPQLILSRNHTQPAPAHHVEGGGDAWDTVKPLSRRFSRLHRVLLFDDDSYKAVAGEESSMVLVPAWGQHEPPNCPVLGELVEALNQELGSCGPEEDVRSHGPAIAARLAKVALPPPTPAPGAVTPSAAGGDTSEGENLGKESDGNGEVSDQQKDDVAVSEEAEEEEESKGGDRLPSHYQLVAAAKDANELDLGDLEEEEG